MRLPAREAVLLIRLLLVAGAFLLTAAAPAQAVEVARIDSAKLAAYDDVDELCLRLTSDATPRQTDGGSAICLSPPQRATAIEALALVRRRTVVIAGTAPPDVARVEAEREDGARFAADTVAGEAYRGRQAGRVRFFLFEMPRGARRLKPVLLRAHGATGTLLGAVGPGTDGEIVEAGPVTLLDERRRGQSVRVTARTVRVRAPTPLALDRMETLACLESRVRTGPFGGGGTSVCRYPSPFRGPLHVQVEQGCGPLRSVLFGLTDAGVRRVRLVLGSGRRLSVPTRPLPVSAGEPLRSVVVRIPRGEAVRGIAGGGVKAPLGAEPGGRPCRDEDGALAVELPSIGRENALPPSPDTQVAAELDGHRLLVRDSENERLCSGVDVLRAGSCLLPPVDADFRLLLVEDGLVSAVLPEEVASVRMPGGRGLATVPGDGYTGRFAGHVRFLLAKVPGGTHGRARLLDAFGAEIGQAVVASTQPTRGPVTLARGRGWRLQAKRVDGRPCVGLDAEGCDSGFGFATTANVRVDCRPRAAVLFGTLDRNTKGVSVRLSDGRRLHARVIRLPRRIGAGRAYVLPLPRRSEVVSLRVGARDQSFHVLPAARQCGYWILEPFLSYAG